MTEDIKITFFIDNDYGNDIRQDPVIFDKKFNLKLYTSSWKLSLNLNQFFFYPATSIRKVFELMYRSVDAPKGFGICKMCLDYLKNIYDNETNEYKKELKKIKSVYKLIDTYLAYYHLFTEGS